MEYVDLVLIHQGNRRSVVEAPAFSVKPGDVIGYKWNEGDEFTAPARCVLVVEKDSDVYNFIRDMHSNPFLSAFAVWNKRELGK